MKMKIIVKIAMIIIQTMMKMVMGKISIVILGIIEKHQEKENKEDLVKI